MVTTPPDRSVAPVLPRTFGHSRTCPKCGQPIEGRLDKRWCGDACRMRDARQRKARELADLVAKMRRLIGG